MGLSQKAIGVKEFGWEDIDEGAANRLRGTTELMHNSGDQRYLPYVSIEPQFLTRDKL